MTRNEALNKGIYLEGKRTKAKKGHPFWKWFFRVFFSLIFVGLLSISSQIIYDYSVYSTFSVNGDSMYPSINRDATRSKDGVTEGGASHDGTWKNYTDLSYEYTCDYGFMDKRGGFKEKLNRFDIVAAFFDSDYDENGNLHSDAELKVKRLYAFPGESFYFDSLGHFLLKKNGASEYVEVEQPSIIVNDGHLEETAKDIIYGAEDSKVTLKDKEYFLLGDNRRSGASDDSRLQGPLGASHLSSPSSPSGYDLIYAKVVAVVGKSILYNNNGKMDKKISYPSFRMPWDIKYL